MCIRDRRWISTTTRAPLPLVGVAADVTKSEMGTYADKHGVGDKYIRSVARWGRCIPVLLPSLLDNPECAEDMNAWASDLLQGLDGLMLAGNPSNLHPSSYNHPVEPYHPPFDQARDALALALIPPALEMGLPLLGVCRCCLLYTSPSPRDS
eukprot:TRINITY_DN23150_c0_g1_i1.p1 TRINITY_DN23150_c0_g1~~TRINITY_DN23150_c0_g1_i1.p1  ORF type:complete len:168 (+),score=32.52 TRINITY_DN23150_c0_g1_i1:50-505(+)